MGRLVPAGVPGGIGRQRTTTRRPPPDHDAFDDKNSDDEEDALYQSYGGVLDHIKAVGDASSSLGLISTLVFSICMNAIIEDYNGEKNVMVLFLALGCLYSTYTMTYSLLEFYYVQTLKCISTFSKRVHEGQRQETPFSSDVRRMSCKRVSETHQEKSDGIENEEEARTKLVSDLEAAFASFNLLRHFARNSMWSSLICLIFATVAKVNFFPKTIVNHTSPEAATALSFLWMTFLTGFCWSGTGSIDFKYQSFFYMTGTVLSAAEVRWDFLTSEINVTKVSTCVFLTMSVLVVPKTVLTFRATFLVIAKTYTRVY